MLAKAAPQPFNSPLHVFERKFNGVRLLALKRGNSIKLTGRSGIEYTDAFPDLVDALRDGVAGDAIVDGEAVCLDKDGQPSFNRVQHRYNQHGAAVKLMMSQYPATYMAFDLLMVGNTDLTMHGEARKLWERQHELQVVVHANGGPLQISRTYDGKHGIELFKQELDAGQEGIMAKAKNSLYIPGGRTEAWQKVKVAHKGSFTICGYTVGTGWREPLFGAIVLGKRRTVKGVVLNDFDYVGCAGSGFTQDQLAALLPRLVKHRTDESPFHVPAKVPGLVSYVRPMITVEVKYGDTTKDGMLIWPIVQKVR
ncbi:MAG: hypothetical protein PHX05_09940 [Acidobacteriota bacterium]|nr:hypothetical protein [Acidobacteriota bacterium]